MLGSFVCTSSYAAGKFARFPQPLTVNSKLQTPNPKPQTSNPKPGISPTFDGSSKRPLLAAGAPERTFGEKPPERTFGEEAAEGLGMPAE